MPAEILVNVLIGIVWFAAVMLRLGKIEGVIRIILAIYTAARHYHDTHNPGLAFGIMCYAVIPLLVWGPSRIKQ